MRYKGGLALLLALVLFVGLFTGCAPGEEEEPVSEGPQVTLENTGESVQLVLAHNYPGEDYMEALEEIIEKYRADFPETEITPVACDTEEQVLAMLRSGEADLVQLESREQGRYVEEGLLWDFYDYLKAWREEYALTNAAKQALYSMGAKHAYMMPADFHQEVMFYRADWLDEYNASQELEQDWLWCRTWSQISLVHEKLGDKGRLAIAGKNRLTDYFDTIMWSRAGRGAMLNPCAGYFAAGKDDGTSLFAASSGELAAQRFLVTMKEDILPGSEDWTTEQALTAFTNGEACMLLADSSFTDELRRALPEGALGVEGFTRCDNNRCVFSADFWGWGISEKSGNKETAIHFLTYLSNSDNNTHMAKVGGTLPLHREGLEMEPSLKDGDRAAEMRMLQLGTEYQYACRPNMYWKQSEEFATEYRRLLMAFLEEELSQEELLEELNSFWQQVYQEQPNNWQVIEPPGEDEEESGVSGTK